MVGMDQGGLSLPDRDYYLSDKFAREEGRLPGLCRSDAGLIGWEHPEENAKAIVDLETSIAQASWSRAERRDPDKTYNPMTPDQLEAPRRVSVARLSGQDRASAGRARLDRRRATAFTKIAAIYGATPLETLKAWSAFRVADGAAPFLSKPFVDANFDFRSKTLSGQTEQRPRWKRAVGVVDRGMGEAVGRVYVARYFPPEAKAKIDALVGELRVALHARIDQLDWMSPETKAKAQRQARHVHGEDRLPGQVARLFRAADRRDDLFGDIARVAGVRMEPAR